MIGSVEGDVHDIGKNICISLLQSQGYEVIDLGIDNEIDYIIERVQADKPDILGLGSYMTTTMVNIPPTFEQLRQAGLTAGMKLLAGGVAVNERWALEVAKADGYAEDAWGLVDLVNELMGVQVQTSSLGYGRDSERTKIV
jgi:methanogenic corrinoid protein MtbC1